MGDTARLTIQRECSPCTRLPIEVRNVEALLVVLLCRRHDNYIANNSTRTERKHRRSIKKLPSSGSLLERKQAGLSLPIFGVCRLMPFRNLS